MPEKQPVVSFALPAADHAKLVDWAREKGRSAGQHAKWIVQNILDQRSGDPPERKPMAARPKQRAKSSRRKSAGRQAGGPRTAPAEPGSAGDSPPPAPGARKRSAPVVPMSEREGEALKRVGIVTDPAGTACSHPKPHDVQSYGTFCNHCRARLR